MAKAFLALIDGRHKTIEPQIGVAIWNVLNGTVETEDSGLTDEQLAYLPRIKDVFIPPSFRSKAAGYNDAHGLTPEGHKQAATNLFHEGVDQGMSQAVPRGDR